MTNRQWNRFIREETYRQLPPAPPAPPRGPVNRGRVAVVYAIGVFLIVFWMGVFSAVANASTMDMQFSVQGVHVSHKQLRQLRDANTAYSQLVHAYWGTPTVRFRTNGPYPLTPVIITNQRGMTKYCGQGAAACHGVDYNGVPIIVVGKYDSTWTLGVSHEIAETLVDPYVNRIVGPRYVEICDAVENNYFTYRHNPSMMSDFALPSWWGMAAGAPYDLGHLLRRPAPEVLFGGYDPLTGNRASVVTSSQLLKRLAT